MIEMTEEDARYLYQMSERGFPVYIHMHVALHFVSVRLYTLVATTEHQYM